VADFCDDWTHEEKIIYLNRTYPEKMACFRGERATSRPSSSKLSCEPGTCVTKGWRRSHRQPRRQRVEQPGLDVAALTQQANQAFMDRFALRTELALAHVERQRQQDDRVAAALGRRGPSRMA